MSISFSGLASGLDTSSWIESLTALKRAKVETYQAEKENVLLSQKTLNSIKSFFSSFRATIEKITDTKFGISSLDLFSQNLAVSSNIKALTATATHEAEQATYTIDVNNLATKTEASSKYSYTTTQTVTATATLKSNLNTLGVKAGQIGVTVNGIERKINLTNSETIQSFTDKLNNIGANASYNENTGKFSVNLSTSAFNDIDNTGILNALHLTGVNEGYVTGSLQLKHENTEYSVATNDTKLTDLGVKVGTITVKANSNSYNISINTNTTIGDFVNSLTSNNIDAKFTEDGYFIMEDAVITDEGTTNILDALGIESPDIYSSSQTSKALFFNTTLVETTVADRNTLLKDIGEGTSIKNNDTVVVSDSNNKFSTITLSSTSTIGELIDKLNTAGLSANIDKNGVVTVSDGSIVGGTFDVKSALNLNETISGKYTTSTSIFVSQTTSIDMTSSNRVTYGENKFATGMDKVFDFMTGASGTVKVVTTDSTGALNTINVTDTTTFSDLFNKLSEVGISGSITDGIVSLVSTNGSYVKSGLESLGISAVTTTETVTTTVGNSKSSALLSYGENKTATGVDKVFDFMPSASGTMKVVTTDSTGALNTINVTNTTTFNDLFSSLSSKGIQASLTDGVISFTSSNGSYIKSGLEALGVSAITNTTSVTTTVGTSKSSSLLSYGEVKSATNSDKVFDFIPGATGTLKVVTTDDTGALSTINVTNTTTFADLFSDLSSKGVQASLTDGVISFTSSNGSYIKSGLEALGVNAITTTTYVTTTVGTSKSSSLLSYTENKLATNSDKVFDFISGATGTLKVVTTDGTGALSTINVTNTTTFNDLFSSLSSKGIQASLTDGIISFSSSNGSYVKSGLEGLGVSAITNTDAVTTTIGTSKTSSNLTYTEVKSATRADKVFDFISGATGTLKVVTTDSTGALSTINVTNTTTFADLFSNLSSKGVQASLTDGVISFTSSNGSYIKNGLEALGVSAITNTTYVTTTVGTSKSSSNLTYSEVKSAVNSDKVFDYISGATGTLKVVTTDGTGALSTINVTNTTTFNDLFSSLSSKGIQASLTDGVISFSSSNGSYVKSGLEGLGVSAITNTTYVTTTVGTSKSTNAFTYQQERDITTSDKISDVVGQNVVSTVRLSDGNITLNNDSTFADLFSKLSEHGIQASLNNGVINLSSSTGKYVDSGLESLGIRAIKTTTNVTTTVGVTKSSSAQTEMVTYDATNSDLMADFLTGIDFSLGDQSIDIFQNGKRVDSEQYGETSTFQDLFDFLDQYDISASLNNGVLTIRNNGDYYIEDNSALTSALGLSTAHTTTYVTTTIATSKSSSQQTIGETRYATMSDKIGDFIDLSTMNTEERTIYIEDEKNYSSATIGSSLANETITITSDMTFSDLSDILETEYGIWMSISNNGIITFDNGHDYDHPGYYINSGGFANVLGISHEFEYEYDQQKSITSKVLQETYTQQATESSLILDYISGQVADGDYNLYLVDQSKLANPDDWKNSEIKDVTIQVNNHTTFGQLFSELANYGIDATFSWGELVINNSDSNYLVNPDYGAAAALGIDAIEDGHTVYTTVGVDATVYLNLETPGTLSMSNHVLSYTEGIGSGGLTGSLPGDHLLDIKNWKSDTIGTITITIDTTFDDFNNALSAYGMSFTINSSNKTLEFTTNENNLYIDGNNSNGYSILNNFGLARVDKGKIKLNNIVGSVIPGLTEDTKLSDLGFTGNLTCIDLYGYGGEKVPVDDIDVTIYGDTVGDALAAIMQEAADYGYSINAEVKNGQVIIQSQEYNGCICSVEIMDGDLLNALGISSNNQRTESSYTLYENPSTSSALIAKRGLVDNATTFEELGASGTIKYRTKYGEDKELIITGDMTVLEFRDQLNLDGIHVDIGYSFYSATSSFDFSSDYTDAYITDFGGVFSAPAGSSYIHNPTDSYTVKSEFILDSYQNESNMLFERTVRTTITRNTTLDSIDAGVVEDIVVKNGDVTHTISGSGERTVGSILDELNAYGISAKLSNGKLSIDGDLSDGYIISGGVLFGFTGSSYTDTFAQISHSSDGNPIFTSNFAIADSSTKLSDLNTSGTIKVNYYGSNYTIDATGDKTVGDIISELSGYGIAASISNGKVTITGNSNAYVTDFGGVFGMTGAGYSTSTSKTVHGTNSADGTGWSRDSYEYATEDTQLGALGYYHSYNIKLKSGGVDYTISTTGTDTVGSVLNRLSAYGIAASLTDGVVTISGTSNAYVTDFAGLFGLTGTGYYTSTTGNVTGYNTNSNHLTNEITVTANGSTTMSQIGQTGNIIVNSGGNTYTVNASGDKTVSDVFRELSAYGVSGSIADGRVTISGTSNGYVTNFGGAFGLTGGAYSTSTSSTVSGYNPNSNNLSHSITVTANSNSTMSQIGKTGNIIVNSGGNTYTVNASGDKTVSEVFRELSAYGISGSISNGKVTISGTSNGYVTNFGGAFGLTGGAYSTSTTSAVSGYNPNSNDLNHTVTTTASGSSTMSQIGKTGNIIVNSGGNTYTVNASGDKTVSEVFRELSAYGISGSIADGRVTISGTSNGYVTNFGGAFGLTGGAYSSSTETSVGGYNPNSSQLSHNVTTTANSNSTMSQIGKTGNIIVNSGGNTYTVNASGDKTVSEVFRELSAYGISGSIADGRVTITGTSNGYVTNFGGAFGLTGSAYSSTTETTVSGYNPNSNDLNHTVTTTASGNSTMSQIGKTGNIIVNSGGNTYTVNASGDKTVSEVFRELSAYGISGSIADGRVTISGTSNGYVTNFGGAFGLTGGAYSSSTETSVGGYNPNSSQLSHNVTTTANSNSTMSQIGKTGNIIVNSGGNTYTVNASGDKTVSEVFRELSAYGISGSIADGRVTISGTSNGYVTNFGGAFGLTGGAYSSTTETTVSGYNPNSNQLSHMVNVKVNDDTTLDQLGISSNGVIGVSENGSNVNVTLNSSLTMAEVKDVLAAHGITMSYIDGVVKLSGSNGSYITSVSNEVKNAFNLTNNGGSGNSYQIAHLPTSSSMMDTKLSDLKTQSGTSLGITSGNIYAYQNGVRNTVSISADDTLESLAAKVSRYGIQMSAGSDGRLYFSAADNSYLSTEGMTSGASNVLEKLGIDFNNWSTAAIYNSSTPVEVQTTSNFDAAATRDTKLSDLGVTAGEYYIYSNGVKNTVYVSSADTLGDFIDTLRTFGIQTSLVDLENGTSVLKTIGKGESYIANSANTSDRSNILDALFGGNTIETTNSYKGYQETSSIVTTYTNATEDTLLSEFDKNGYKAEGNLNVTVNGENLTVKIDSDETIGSMLEKFRSLGLEATLSNGEIMIQSGFDTLNITSAGSGLLNTLGLTYNADLGGYAATAPDCTVTSTTTLVESHTDSVANFASDSTKLNLLNISSGSLTIYRDGEKAVVQVDENQTFGDLKAKISAKLSDVTITFDNGKLIIGSNKEGSQVVVGATTDTSNFSAITGISDVDGKAVSSRALYCINGDSVVTKSGLFVTGQVNEGDFYVGDARINIDNKTTINDIISQINYNDESGATAFWDSIDGKLVIKSKSSGSSLINIEAGTSNFTDVMGYTTDMGGVSKMNVDTQELGKNASFTINGTRFVSSSNTVTSDVTRIKGVTLNLKDITQADEPVTLTIERDKETVANAVSDIVDAYNALIENVDKEIAKDGNLKDESTLRLLRNQIRSLMTNSISGAGTFRNLNNIGISLTAASGTNIRTDNIDVLTFDKDKFIESFNADNQSLKTLLVGDDSKKGILSMVEDVLDQSLGSVTGYFASAEKSYNNKISKLNSKVDAANRAADRYKMRLEAKFKVMDRLISNVQNNYSSFLAS